MHTTRAFRWQRLIAATTLSAVLLASGAARADERDNAVVGKMTLLNRKAIEQYQALAFDEAQRLLREALDLAESSGLLQHPLRARTFVTLGIVTLGGLKQRDEAIRLFRKALQIQPEIKLSRGLANPEIQSAFDEAVEGLSRSPGIADVPAAVSPEKMLAHDPVRTSHRRSSIAIVVSPDRSLSPNSSVILSYRPAGSGVFTEETMQLRPSGIYEGEIPAAATDGAEVAYYLEARDAGGKSLVARGSSASPFVVALSGSIGGADLSTRTPEATQTTTATPTSYKNERKLVLSLSVGTGFGTVSGNAEETQQPVSGTHWSVVHIAPMIGYFVTPQLMLAVQGRLQIVSGANDYHIPDPTVGSNGSKECGDGVCTSATGALAVLGKGAWFFTGPDSAFRPYLSLSVGGGTIRHVTSVSASTCGKGSDPCKDTVAGGPFLFGPGLGFDYQVSDGVGIVVAVEALIGTPNTTVNADANLGMSLKF